MVSLVKADNNNSSKAYIHILLGNFQKLTDQPSKEQSGSVKLQGIIEGGAGEEELQAGVKELVDCIVEAGGGGEGADWSHLDPLAEQPGEWGPGHYQPPKKHLASLIRPQWANNLSCFLQK